MQHFNWLKLVTWLAAANQSALFKCRYDTVRFAYDMGSWIWTADLWWKERNSSTNFALHHWNESLTSFHTQLNSFFFFLNGPTPASFLFYFSVLFNWTLTTQFIDYLVFTRFELISSTDLDLYWLSIPSISRPKVSNHLHCFVKENSRVHRHLHLFFNFQFDLLQI